MYLCCIIYTHTYIFIKFLSDDDLDNVENSQKETMLLFIKSDYAPNIRLNFYPMLTEEIS